jgi:hypothetical protein
MGALDLREGLGELRERLAAPQAQRLAQRRGRLGRVTGKVRRSFRF